MTNLTDPIFHDETKARAHLEALRWPNGPICPHCGSEDKATKLKGKSTRPGVYKCKECRKPFSVSVGTLFERSHVPLHKWVLAFHLMSASKKGMSAHQLHRMLDVQYKTAWFMAHRIREAMREKHTGPLGGSGIKVEVDETYVGGRKKRKKNAEGKKVSTYDKEPVLSLVERGGKVRSFHMERVTSASVGKVLRTQLKRDSDLRTDEAMYYRRVGAEYASHLRVNHSLHEYVRGDAYTNTVEGYFSIFKRGLNGVYQHVSAKHLKRYVGEFDFRFNHRHLTDTERAAVALKGIEGKRLTYQQTGERG